MIDKIYLDLDGVMVDIDAKLETIFGRKVGYGEIGSNVFWKELEKIPNFFLDLKPMPYYRTLFNYLKSTGVSVEILTSIPLPTGNLSTAREDKITWVRRHLDKDIIVNTVTGGKEKAKFVRSKRDLLIDDLPRNIECWEVSGGTGILFKNNADTIVRVHQILGKV